MISAPGNIYKIFLLFALNLLFITVEVKFVRQILYPPVNGASLGCYIYIYIFFFYLVLAKHNNKTGERGSQKFTINNYYYSTILLVHMISYY